MSPAKHPLGARQRVAPKPQRRRPTRRARSQRTTRALRWCFGAVAAGVGFLYYQPLTSYVETRSEVNERAAEVRALSEENARLQRRLEQSTTLAALSREARRNGLVRPGERLFIVKGIEEWRAARRTMRRDG